MNLFDKTLNLIKDRPASISLQDISKATEIKYSWICKFHAGLITNPAYKTLQILHDYLIDKVKLQA